MSKIISFLEAVGAILIVAALALWSGEYWKTSNILWWTGLACVTPAIAWKAWPQSFWRQAFIGLVFCILVFIGNQGEDTISARNNDTQIRDNHA